MLQEKFAKIDLESGMIVKLRSGDYGVVLKNIIIGPKDVIIFGTDEPYKDLSNYNDSLRHIHESIYDIIEVSRPYDVEDIMHPDTENREVLWRDSKVYYIYKPGEKVKVKNNLHVGGHYPTWDVGNNVGFVESMEKFRGKTVTIKSHVGNGRYHIEEDGSWCYWVDSMFESKEDNIAEISIDNEIYISREDDFVIIKIPSNLNIMFD